MRFEGSYPAIPLAVGAIRGEMTVIARECGLGEAAVQEVALAVSEAATNAVIHAYQHTEGSIRVLATQSAGELAITISDDGPGLSPRRDSPGLGLGLALIASVARRLEIEGSVDGTALTMVFPCPQECAA